jgi:DNA-binding SARP family transcriptional activator/tetratricopeptide (TPR) repeat protein/TolB-like protein
VIELRVLGTLDLRESPDGHRIMPVLAQPKRTALLAYLAVATPRGLHSRDRLMLLFWPDATQERARNSLNQAVFNLRRALGEDAIVTSGDGVQLARGSLRCDAATFDELLDAKKAGEALELYGGDLLPGFHIDDCPEFEQWLNAERDRLRRRAIAATASRGEELERTGDVPGAIELLHRATLWSGGDQATVERLIRLLVRSGDTAGALREYEQLRRRLDSDLGIAPSRQLQELAERIRAGELTAGAAPPVRATARAPVSAGLNSSESASPVSSTLGEAADPGSDAGRRASVRSRRLRAVAGAAAAAVLVAAAGWLAWPSASGKGAGVPDPVPLDGRRVLVAAFENRTGDQSLEPLGYMAADWIAQGIASAAIARVVPFSTVVQEAPHLQAGSGPGTIGAANRQLAQRIGAGLLVAGAFYRAGDSLAFQAQVVDVATGELLRAIEGVRGQPARPADAADELQRRTLGAVATLLDERLESWPDGTGQAHSLESYQRFAEGMREFLTANRDFGSPNAARRSHTAAAQFMGAVQIDSSFTTALLWAGYAYISARDSAAAAGVTERLQKRPLSAWSRAVLNHQRAVLAHDREAAYAAAVSLADMSPDSEWLFKLASAALETERYEEALRAFLRVDPNRGWIRDWPSYWRLRTEVQHILRRHDAALADARAGLALNPGEPWLHTQELWALAALGRADEIEAALTPALGAADGFAHWRLQMAVDELLAHGHASAARRLARRGVELADTASRVGGGLRAEIAYLMYQAGRPAESLQLYRSLPRAMAAGEHRVRFALISAEGGDPTAAAETMQWLQSLGGEELKEIAPPQIRLWGTARAWSTLARARLAAVSGDRGLAMQLIHEAREQGLRHTYLHLHTNRHLTSLRRDPQYQALLRGRD